MGLPAEWGRIPPPPFALRSNPRGAGRKTKGPSSGGPEGAPEALAAAKKVGATAAAALVLMERLYIEDVLGDKPAS